MNEFIVNKDELGFKKAYSNMFTSKELNHVYYILLYEYEVLELKSHPRVFLNEKTYSGWIRSFRYRARPLFRRFSYIIDAHQKWNWKKPQTQSVEMLEEIKNKKE